MKPFVAFAIGVLAVATGISAQTVVTMTEYYDDCSTNTGPSYNSTVTATILSTYCPKCEGMGFSSAAPTAPGGFVFTTYTTVYSQLCPTGLQEVTYTVTESCSSMGGIPRTSGYVPQGFTVTTVECTVCEGMSMATITTPIATPATPPAVAPTPYIAPAGTPIAPLPASSVIAPEAYPVSTAEAATTIYHGPVESVYTLEQIPAPSASGIAPGLISGTIISPPIESYRGAAAAFTPMGKIALAVAALAAGFHYVL